MEKKKIKEEFDNDMTLANKETEYEENGLKINVNHTLRSTGYSTDSIYYEGNKKVKHIYNSDYDGTITLEISEYDEQGNIIKKTKNSDGCQTMKLPVECKLIYTKSRYNYPDNDMKPETAYKLVKVWSLSNATIMTLLFIIQCDSLWHAFCVIFTIPLLGIGTIVMYENQSNDYTALKENLTEKKKKEMPYIRWDEVIKDARKDYLWGSNR